MSAEPHRPTTPEPKTYMPETPFNPSGWRELEYGRTSSCYEVQVDESGVTVISECCADTIGLETARTLHAALGAWLADQPEES